MPRFAVQGFTLIELSIVLVIIGLIVGAVLVGENLIHAAAIRASISQKEKYETAVKTFQIKYNCLPGDCANVDTFGFNSTTSGNGDGNIGLCNVPSCNYTQFGQVIGENFYFWYHLGQAGLIDFTFPPLPLSSVQAGVISPPTKLTAGSGSRGGWAVQAGLIFSTTAVTFTLSPGTSFNWPAHELIMTSSQADASNGTAGGGFLPVDMLAIDTKMDDGLPLMGSVVAWNFANIDMLGSQSSFFGYLSSGVGIGAGGPGTSVCVRNDTTPNQYNVQSSLQSLWGFCNLAFRTSF